MKMEFSRHLEMWCNTDRDHTDFTLTEHSASGGAMSPLRNLLPFPITQWECGVCRECLSSRVGNLMVFGNAHAAARAASPKP